MNFVTACSHSTEKALTHDITVFFLTKCSKVGHGYANHYYLQVEKKDYDRMAWVKRDYNLLQAIFSCGMEVYELKIRLHSQ